MSSRDGRQALTTWISRETHTALKIRAAETDEQVQDVVEAALKAVE